MKPINIINKLNESNSIEEIKKLPDWIKEKLIEDGSATYWYCDNCGEYFEEPHVERTNIEDYYGVGSDFPDSHYEDLIMCPHCKCGLSEESISIEDISDEISSSDYDMFIKAMEIYEEMNPEIVGEFYRREGTHHCSIFEDNPEYLDEAVVEMLKRGII